MAISDNIQPSQFLAYNYSGVTSNNNSQLYFYDWDSGNNRWKGSAALTENTDGTLTFWMWNANWFADVWSETYQFTFNVTGGSPDQTVSSGPGNYGLNSYFGGNQGDMLLGNYSLFYNNPPALLPPHDQVIINGLKVLRVRLTPRPSSGSTTAGMVFNLLNVSHFENGKHQNYYLDDGNGQAGPLILQGVYIPPPPVPTLVSATPSSFNRGQTITISATNLTSDYRFYLNDLSHPCITLATSSSSASIVIPTNAPVGAGTLSASNGTFQTNSLSIAVVTTILYSGYSNEDNQYFALPTVVPPSPTLVQISVSPASIILTAGQSQQFIATGTLNNGTTKQLSAADGLAWSIQNLDGIGSIDPNNGFFVAQLPGSNIQVIATVGNITGTATVKIAQRPIPPSQLESLTITPANPTIELGQSVQFHCSGVAKVFQNVGGQVVSSDQAIFPAVTWNTQAVTGNGGIDSFGLFTSTALGTVNVIASAQDGSGITTQQTVTILPVPAPPPANPFLKSIDLEPKSAVVAAGQTQQFTVTGMDQYGHPIPVSVAWSISNKIGAGTIDQNGLFTAQVAGTQIVVSVQTGDTLFKDQANIVVIAGPATRITVTPAVTTLKATQGQQFTVSGYDLYNNAKILTGVIWSMVGGVGTTDQNGLFAATTPGVGKIVATYNTIQGSATCNVLQTVGGLAVTNIPQQPFARIHIRNTVDLPLVLDSRSRGGGITEDLIDIGDDFWWDLAPFDGEAFQNYGVFAANVVLPATANQVSDPGTSQNLIQQVFSKYAVPHFLGVITPASRVPQTIY